MDCYLKGVYKILFVDSPQITVEEFGFLTGYTVSRAWIDKSVAKSFDLPVIYPSWYPDTEYFIEIFSQLRMERFSNFEDYVGCLDRQLARGPVLTPIDRYFIDYISPRRHMGAHYILIHEYTKEGVCFFDPYDDEYHLLSTEMLKEATSPSEKSVQHEGWMVIYRDDSNDIGDRAVSLLDCVQQRILRCRETLSNLEEFKSKNISPVSRLAIKIAYQGILQSDFYRANGYKENEVFYRNHRIVCSAFLARMLARYYRAIASIYGWFYVKRFPVTSIHWRSFLILYRLGLKIELADYLLIYGLIWLGIKTDKRYYWE